MFNKKCVVGVMILILMMSQVGCGISTIQSSQETGTTQDIEKEYHVSGNKIALGATIEDSPESVKEIGIELGDIEYKCYSLDYKTLSSEEYAMDKDGNEDKSKYKDQWTKKDNCYYFCIRQKKNDVIEYHKLYGFWEKFEDRNCPIQALVSADGIMGLEIDATTGEEILSTVTPAK